jgi:mRNA interferase MazF
MVKTRAYVPQRGDFVFLDFNPQTGREQTGRRPALVLSPGEYNSRTGLALMCPLTSRVKGYPFEVEVSSGGKISGAVLSDHVKTLDWRVRKAQFAEKAPAIVLDEVLAKLNALIFEE